MLVEHLRNQWRVDCAVEGIRVLFKDRWSLENKKENISSRMVQPTPTLSQLADRIAMATYFIEKERERDSLY